MVPSWCSWRKLGWWSFVQEKVKTEMSDEDIRNIAGPGGRAEIRCHGLSPLRLVLQASAPSCTAGLVHRQGRGRAPGRRIPLAGTPLSPGRRMQQEQHVNGAPRHGPRAGCLSLSVGGRSGLGRDHRELETSRSDHRAAMWMIS